MHAGMRGHLLPLLLALLACKSTPDTSMTTSSAAPATALPPPVSSAIARMQVQVSMRTSDHLAVLRDVFDGKADAAAVRVFFDPGVTGDAPAAALFDHVTKLAKDGWKVQRFEVRTIRVDDGAAKVTADVFEWLVRDGASQCRTYRVPWLIRPQNAYREAAFDVREAQCPAAK